MTKSPKAVNFGDLYVQYTYLCVYIHMYVFIDNARQIIRHKYQTWQRNEQYFALSHIYAVFMVSVYFKNVPEIIRNERTKKGQKSAGE